MADIIKKVTPTVPPTARYQTFTQADGGAGDVFMVKDSLGAAANYVSIEAAANMTVRFNVYHTVYPNREHLTDFMHASHLPNLALGETIKDESVASGIDIATGESLELDGDFPVSDIEILSAAGDFTIIVT